MFLIAAVISLVFFVVLYIYIFLSEMNDGGVYNKSDFFKYHMLTDSEILNAPRISEYYYFEYHPGDGYPLSNSITFTNTTNTTNAESLRKYFAGKGYKFHKRIYDKNEFVWESRCTLNQPASLYLSVNYAEQIVQLEKKSCD